MLSFFDGSLDWPLTSRGRTRNLSFSHLGRSLSTPLPSPDCSDDSENTSPVQGIHFEQVFVSISAASISTGEYKRKLPIKVDKEKKIVDNSVPKNLEEFQIVNLNNMEAKIDQVKRKKKKKKWQILEISEFSFNLSLLPRPSTHSNIDEKEVTEILTKIDEDYLSMEERLAPYSHLLKYEGNRLEDKTVRSDRDRKTRKAHKQVKDKHCVSIRNNKGRKHLYVHHRVMKLMDLKDKRSYHHHPMPPRKNLSDDEVANCRQMPNGGGAGCIYPQNLTHVLHEDNDDLGELPTDLVSLLITLQHRDISPEDYEVLLRLDESVVPKTISDSLLNGFETDVVDENSACEVCSVCMDRYEVGQMRKYLPCGHMFHDGCIDMWLKNSSLNCPLDGLPVST